jgi:hypothetical protein
LNADKMREFAFLGRIGAGSERASGAVCRAENLFLEEE